MIGIVCTQARVAGVVFATQYKFGVSSPFTSVFERLGAQLDFRGSMAPLLFTTSKRNMCMMFRHDRYFNYEKKLNVEPVKGTVKEKEVRVTDPKTELVVQWVVPDALDRREVIVKKVKDGWGDRDTGVNDSGAFCLYG